MLLGVTAGTFSAFPRTYMGGAPCRKNSRSYQTINCANVSNAWPLAHEETIVRLISATKTAKGLTVRCRLDRRNYPLGRRVTKEELASLHIVRNAFHGEWNYVIRPRRPVNARDRLMTKQ